MIVTDMSARVEMEEAESLKNISIAIRGGNTEIIDFWLNLSYFNDERPGYDIAYCVEYLGKIIKNVPEYKNKIISELINHQEITLFKQKQFAILDYYILKLIDENFSELNNEGEIFEYIIKKQKSVYKKTRKKSKELFKKYMAN